MELLTFDTYTDARTHLKEVYDAAESGRSAVLRRDNIDSVVVNAGQLRHFLAVTTAGRVLAVAEGAGWSLMLPGTPIAAHGTDLDEAVVEFVDALREYAADWLDHLLNVANHQDNWGLVQLIGLSSDEQLSAWVTGAKD